MSEKRFEIGDIVRIRATDAGLPASGKYQIVEIDKGYTCPYVLRSVAGDNQLTATGNALEIAPDELEVAE